MALPWRLLIACLFLVFALPAAANAQQIECSRADDRTQAEALFRAGVAASDAGRWADAVDSLRRAYVLSCEPAALFNLGASLRALGRHHEARDAFQQLLTAGGIPDEMRTIAAGFLAEERARVAIIELLEIDQSVRPEISFDGRVVVDDGARPIRLETDAGSHSLVLRIDEHQPFLWNGDLTDGQVERISVNFEPIPTRVTGGDDGAVVGVILGVVGALLVAGGVVLGVVLQDDAQLQPNSPDRVIRLGRD